MDVSHPYTAIASGLDPDVLVTLAGTTRPLTGRRVAELAGHSQRGVLRALDRFVEHGLVLRTPAGRALMHQLNREHLAAPAVELLAGMRTELLNRLRVAFAGWEVPPVHASVFGSAAREDGDTGSDIDLFVVRPASVDEETAAWRSQVERLIDDARSWTGNHVTVIEQAEPDVGRLRRSKPPVLKELRRDGIHLAGTPLCELLGPSR
ncbi:MAG: nucleotidyltransferase family protein [Thermoleophilaceae bacterium]